MNIKTMAEATIAGGVTPLCLEVTPLRLFDSGKVLLRTRLVIRSLDLGVLTPAEYRYVARRSKRGSALVARQIEKIFANYESLRVATADLLAVSLPVFAKTLLSGEAAALIFQALAANPHISAGEICVEISSDILFEDMTLVKKRIDELRGMGVRVAIFEVGDPFCPVFRLSELQFDYVFTDAKAAERLAAEEGEAAKALPRFLHAMSIKVYALDLPDDAIVQRAKAAEYDGYGKTDATFQVEEGGHENG